MIFSEGMLPWALGEKYDRPIPRRLLEEAVVPRKEFGIRKKATFTPRSFFWPFTKECQGNFNEYLQQYGLFVPSRIWIWLLRKLSHADQLIIVNLNHLLGTRFKGMRPYFSLKGQELLFQWANHTLKKRYAEALKRNSISLEG